MKSCFAYENDGYYKEVNLPLGFKARIRSLNDNDFSEIRKKAGFKFNLTKDVIEKMKKDKDFQPDYEMDIEVFRKEQTVASLTDPVGTSYEKGGAGWDLKDAKGNTVEVTRKNIDLILPEIRIAIDDAILEFKKANDDLLELGKN